ncbi:MAG: NAD-dependent epimerase/dehydratase family protein [Cyclobacteriaceae bacterium]
MKEIDFLLTGGSGFLGKIIRKALSQNYTICTLGRSSEAEINCNLSNEVPRLETLSIKAVIHAAGKAHVIPKNKQEVEEFELVNFNGTVNLTRGLIVMNQLPSSLIFISTVAVYGVEEGFNIDEKHPLKGETPYARSKIKAEEFLIHWCNENKIRLTILRLPLVVGENPPGNLGSILRWMRRGLYIGIGNGNARRSMVLAEDVGNFIPSVSKIGGLYNLTDGYNPSIKEIEHAIASELNLSKPLRLPEGVINVAARIGDVIGSWVPLNSVRLRKLTSSLIFSDSKAREIGWNPRPVIHNLHFK